MTPPESNNVISACALRQFMSAASDAGLGSIVSVNSVHNDGEHIIITIDARAARSLTNWFSFMAESHCDTPITANTLSGRSTVAGEAPAWMRDVINIRRATPIGYESVAIPSRHEGPNQ